MSEVPSAEKGAAFTEACQPYGCTCDGHRWPGVSHMVPCCDEPHIDQQASVLPPGSGRTESDPPATNGRVSTAQSADGDSA